MRLKAPINAGHITATHDTVCYDNTATLHASSDIGFPQYYSWYNSDGTTLLYRDTARNAGDISTFKPNHQKTDTHYYVAIHDQNNCPYVPNTKLTKKTIWENFLLGPSNTGGTTNITKFDSIPFYDEGGPNDDPTHKGTWIHTFTTDTGHVILRLDKLSFSCGYGVSSSGVYDYNCYLNRLVAAMGFPVVGCMIIIVILIV